MKINEKTILYKFIKKKIKIDNNIMFYKSLSIRYDYLIKVKKYSNNLFFFYLKNLLKSFIILIHLIFSKKIYYDKNVFITINHNISPIIKKIYPELNFEILRNYKILYSSNKVKFIKNYIFLLFEFFPLYIKSMIFFHIKINYSELLYNIALSKLMKKEVYYFGRLYSINQYISCLITSYYCNTNIIIGSTFLFGNSRYTYLPYTNIHYPAKYLKTEIKNYENFNWIKIKSLKHIDSINSNEIMNIKPIFDIGIYSSGSWARKGGLVRVRSISNVRNYKYINNYFYKTFENNVLNNILKIKKDMNLSVKLYLHPYERILFKEYNILPPYYDKCLEHKIILDFDDNDSYKKMKECKIGVSLMSTIIFERWENNLLGFVYYDKNVDSKYKEFNPKYWGDYSRNSFNSKNKLKENIEVIL